MTSAPADGEPLRVLIVDDEEGMREGMRRILEKRGYLVDVAENGSQAIGRIGGRSYDLALIDLRMPEVDGFAVTEHIARVCDGKTVVVIVSALATVEAAVDTTRNGAFDFLVKPFAPDDLLRVVERAAGQCCLIREREKYLVELATERSLSRLMINSMHEGVIIFNLRGEVVLCNPRAELYLGAGCGSRCDDEPLGPLLGDAVGAILRDDGGERVLSREVSGYHLTIRIAPYLANGGTGGVIVLLHDVTEEWKAEQDKSRFVSMVVHELNGPLAAIMSYVNLMLDGSLSGEPGRTREVLERIKARGSGLLDLVRELLALNRATSGTAEKTLSRIDLASVLREQIAFVQEEATRARVAVRFEAHAGSYPFMANRSDLDRIFLNLLFNGIKYNLPNGTLEVDLRPSADGSWTLVSFKDSGIGMSEEEMKSLFQEFYRAKNPRTQSVPGTGLGLATAKRVLSGYNGRIEVQSAPGKGSTFTVKLPASGRG